MHATAMSKTAAVLQEMKRSDVRAMLDEVEKVDEERAQELRGMVNTFDMLLAANDTGHEAVTIVTVGSVAVGQCCHVAKDVCPAQLAFFVSDKVVSGILIGDQNGFRLLTKEFFGGHLATGMMCHEESEFFIAGLPHPAALFIPLMTGCIGMYHR